MFCATSALGIYWKHLNHPNLLVRSVGRFHVDFHVRIILHHLGISLPRKNRFSKVNFSYIKRGYYSICNYYGVNADKWRLVFYDNGSICVRNKLHQLGFLAQHDLGSIKNLSYSHFVFVSYLAY